MLVWEFDPCRLPVFPAQRPDTHCRVYTKTRGYLTCETFRITNTKLMSKKNYLLIFLCLLFYQLLPAQDGKLSWYYPTLGEANPRTNPKGSSHILNSHGIAGCVSGNCKSGTGEYLKAYPSQDAKRNSMDINPVIRLTLYKGNFSNDGKYFDGTVFVRDVEYDVVYKKDDPRLVPKIKEDLREASFWQAFEVASGSMQFVGTPGYTWHGWMQPSQKPGAAVLPGQPVSTKSHFMEGIAHVKNQYAPGGVYTEVEGRAFENGELMGGRIRFSDGSVYEGMLHAGRRFGPGRYISDDGKTQEGIWMLDSLAIPTVVALPAALFEPEKGGVAVLANIEIGRYPALEFKDAGKGWVYAFYSNVLFIGKLENGKLNGPGYWKDRSTFFTGVFKDGSLESGMKIIENIYANKKYTTVVTGQFKDGQLKPSCAKMVRYDWKGTRLSMTEGFFYPSQDKESEFADGWVYVNDWEGKRDPVNLQYFYNGQNYLTMDGKPNYVSWFTKGLKESSAANFCFPAMKEQAAPILAQMKLRHDSVVVLASKNEADIAASKTAWHKIRADREAACKADLTKYILPSGELYETEENGRRVKFLVMGPYDCDMKKFPVMTLYWTAPVKKNGTGYWYTTYTSMTFDKIKKSPKLASDRQICSYCGGRGTQSHTYWNSVGGNSGYTDVGGGWMVKNPETYWKEEITSSCSECGGEGVRKR